MSSGGVLALWKRWYRSDGELTDDTAMFAAALAALNIMGATLSVLWLVLPHPAEAREGVIVTATLAAYVLGTFLVLGPRQKRWWIFQASIALDTLVISIALAATRDPGSVYAFYYLWATLYAVCFFSRRQIALQGVWVCVAYAGSLALIGGNPAALLSQWLLPMVTLLAAGTLVRQLTGRLRRSEATLRHDAGHDPLTGLPNRALFGERPMQIAVSDRLQLENELRKRSKPTRSTSPTSRSCDSPTARRPAPRRSRAGRIPRSARSRPPSSSPSPRRPA